jgi:hypothetical protein
LGLGAIGKSLQGSAKIAFGVDQEVGADHNAIAGLSVCL